MEEFVQNVPPDESPSRGARPWTRAMFEAYDPSGSHLVVTFADNSERVFRTEFDRVKAAVALVDTRAPDVKEVFAWSRRDAQHINLQRLDPAESLVIKLRRTDESRFTLLRGGFRWIRW